MKKTVFFYESTEETKLENLQRRSRSRTKQAAFEAFGWLQWVFGGALGILLIWLSLAAIFVKLWGILSPVFSVLIDEVSSLVSKSSPKNFSKLFTFLGYCNQLAHMEDVHSAEMLGIYKIFFFKDNLDLNKFVNFAVQVFNLT